MTNPYTALPKTAFWKTAVPEQKPMQIGGLWKPKFPIRPDHGIVTAGSCFAQHIGRTLAGRRYNWLDCEPAPMYLSDQDSRDFNYGIFSFRAGNIYTAKMLRQWLMLAFDPTAQDFADEFWEVDGRFFDPLRPVIEPGGFASADELLKSRAATLAAIRKAVQRARVFIFTMGLTESWRNRKTGMEYAMCPGTAGGTFDAQLHEFHNHSHGEILKDMRRSLAIMRGASPRLRVLLTVSPVPLTATASGQHVLNATTYSKSVLRSVAGHLTAAKGFVDYFPSYEIITAPPFGGRFYGPNKRSVLPKGVNFVMQNFFADQQATFDVVKQRRLEHPMPAVKRDKVISADVRCEEELLDAFTAR